MTAPIQFTTKAYKLGGSTSTTIPPKICEHLNIKPGNELTQTVNNNEIRITKKEERVVKA